MTELAEKYISVDLKQKFRRQATIVWSAGLTVISVWFALIVAAPLLRVENMDAFSAPLYRFFGHVCHQMPARSLWLAGQQLAVCSRCFGVYFGLLAGFILYPLWRRTEEIEPLPRIWLFLSLIPIGVDWSLTVFGIWENTHASRFVTGTILGFACAVYIVPALVEIVRNSSVRLARET